MLKEFMLSKMRTIETDKRLSAALCNEVANRKLGKQTANMVSLLDGFQGTREEELAVHTALALYAYHSRLTHGKVHCHGVSFGSAVKKLMDKKTGMSELYRKRFNNAATARALSEFASHTDALVKLFAQSGISLDYLMLAEHLVGFQEREEVGNIRLSWARDLYTV